MSLADKKILLIGATGGIGRAVVRQLAAQNSHLVLCGRHQAPLDIQLAELGKHEGNHKILVADIVRKTGRTDIINELQRSHIDVVINLAGINELTAFETQTPESIENIITTNLTSVLLLCREIIAEFQAKQAGVIINIGSTLGAIGLPGYATYCASKFALRGFSESLSRELADSPVQVKYFAPRTTQTAMNSDLVSAMNKELGNKADSPEQVAQELIKFMQTESDSYHVGWPEKLFVKINAVFPAVVSKNLKKQLPIFSKYMH
jgi:short-subunit dehydrogenase